MPCLFSFRKNLQEVFDWGFFGVFPGLDVRGSAFNFKNIFAFEDVFAAEMVLLMLMLLSVSTTLLQQSLQMTNR